ncbi:MAG: sugar ABC transporter ATP-binding protein, partial [Planctomycetaceae bacterium]|nr:sugar ABC transporter ATP-binding protein [Planctomycetaceae bacterium]
MTSSPVNFPLLSVSNVSKAFPGVQALQDVCLTLQAGQVLALMGENGAGKSTLIKILGGAHPQDEGSLELQGKPTRIASPHHAQQLGISIIYQEFNLVPGLSAGENIFLGNELARWGIISRREETRRAKQLFERLGLSIDPETPCSRLTVAQQQAVEIAKALALDARIIVMDEPSAALSPREVEGLLTIVRELKSSGIGIIYISHRLEEILSIADRAMILRDGQHVGTRPIGNLSRDQMIEMMVGRSLDQEFPKRPAEIGEPRLVASHLTRGEQVRDVSFEIRRGEVLGLTGLIGAGRTEVARLLFGADRLDQGTISLDGRPLKIRSPRDAIAAGICLLTEDRKAEGLVLSQSVQENFGLPNMKRLAPGGWIRLKQEQDSLKGYIDQLAIKVSSPGQRVSTLSGGNQQKVVLAKWLEHNTDVLIFDEPTRGIDVGAKYEIYQLINRLAAQGKAILMISSELPEILGMADRI